MSPLRGRDTSRLSLSTGIPDQLQWAGGSPESRVTMLILCDSKIKNIDPFNLGASKAPPAREPDTCFSIKRVQAFSPLCRPTFPFEPAPASSCYSQVSGYTQAKDEQLKRQRDVPPPPHTHTQKGMWMVNVEGFILSG